MDVDELVQTIAQEVIKQLQSTNRKECLMVMAERDESMTAKISALVGDQKDIFYCEEDICHQTICRYILPFLSCSDMADLATGKAQGLYLTEVLNLLLQGSEVEILEFEYKAYSETAPGPLYSLYESHQETLAGFGLKPFQPKQPDAIRFRDTLVTDQVVNETQQQGASVLMVPLAAQITPLAAETARNLRVNIQKCL